jgi:hypothetical protein
MDALVIPRATQRPLRETGGMPKKKQPKNNVKLTEDFNL